MNSKYDMIDEDNEDLCEVCEHTIHTPSREPGLCHYCYVDKQAYWADMKYDEQRDKKMEREFNEKED